MGIIRTMLTYELDTTAAEPLYIQLYRHIRTDIESGMLRAQERLPSKRALSEHLGISVITVEGALRQLSAEGYITSEARRGIFVCPDATLNALQRKTINTSLPDAPDTSSISTGTNAPSLIADLTGATPPTGVFPYTAWARTMRTALSSENEATLLQASDAQGSLMLRNAICNHLRGTRGMQVCPSQVVIGSGAQSLYNMVVQLLGRQRTFAIENPGYPRLAKVYCANDITLTTVGMDDKGPRIDELEASEASVFHCMPSHQFPLGITTAIGRRRELLAWAANNTCQHKRYLIEDDYDCEFRMRGRPVPPLQTLDDAEQVIYANTFTKTLGAAFRIGYLILPPHLAERFQKELGFYTCTVGALEQLTLARFINSGEYERHVNRQRTYFRKRGTELIEALAQTPCGAHLRFHNTEPGLHFLMEVEQPADPGAFEQAVTARACNSGVNLAPLDNFFLGPRTTPMTAFVMNYASLQQSNLHQAADIISHTIMTISHQSLKAL